MAYCSKIVNCLSHTLSCWLWTCIPGAYPSVIIHNLEWAYDFDRCLLLYLMDTKLHTQLWINTFFALCSPWILSILRVILTLWNLRLLARDLNWLLHSVYKGISLLQFMFQISLSHFLILFEWYHFSHLLCVITLNIVDFLLEWVYYLCVFLAFLLHLLHIPLLILLLILNFQALILILSQLLVQNHLFAEISYLWFHYWNFVLNAHGRVKLANALWHWHRENLQVFILELRFIVLYKWGVTSHLD